ncbi:MAG: response regulator, partial [Desulfovibrio sp.]|nr:response regulator [Desulfovibrio sp.]
MQKDVVLIVEDDEDILQLLTYNLENAGFEVLTSADGYEGMNLARRHNPNLILLDIMLPNVDGFEVCKELKRRPETAGIPVIML